MLLLHYSSFSTNAIKHLLYLLLDIKTILLPLLLNNSRKSKSCYYRKKVKYLNWYLQFKFNHGLLETI